MKKINVLFAMCVFSIVLVGCGGFFGKDADRYNWVGLMPQEEYSRHQDEMADLELKEAHGKTLITVERLLQDAILRGDQGEIDKLINLKEKLSSGNVSGLPEQKTEPGTRKKRIRNYSSYIISINSGPFTGEVIKPDDRSKRAEILPVGKIIFEIDWEDVRSGSVGRKKVAKIVTDDNRDIEFYNR